jgi:hypothetical protein
MVLSCQLYLFPWKVTGFLKDSNTASYLAKECISGTLNSVSGDEALTGDFCHPCSICKLRETCC